MLEFIMRELEAAASSGDLDSWSEYDSQITNPAKLPAPYRRRYVGASRTLIRTCSPMNNARQALEA